MMGFARAAFVGIASLAAAGCAVAPPRAAAVQVAANSPIELPARFVSRLVLIDVSIDGQKVAPFLLDTGSDVTVIDQRTRNNFLFRPESAAIARGAGGSVSSSFVRGKSLDAGALHVDFPVFLVLDLARFERAVGTPVGGILGLDVLDGLAVSIDYPGRRVRVAASGLLAIEGAARIPIERRENLIGIALDTKGGPLPVLLDTGMTGTLAVEEGEAKRRGVEADPTRSPEWRVGIGGGKASPVAKIPWAQLGGRWIPSLEVVLEKPAGGFAGAVGCGLLRFFEVVVDLGTNTVQLGSEPSELAEPSPTNPSGMRIDTRFDFPAEGWRVDAVRAGSPAAKAGIRAGDVVVELAGESVRRADWRRMRDALAMASGELRVRTLGPEGPVERVLRR